jgi:DNA-binding transcriptional ArsR family regulator
MKKKPKTARALVLDALLAGQEICAGPFSRSVKCADSTVTKVLKSLGNALRVRIEIGGPGYQRMYYSMANRDAVEKMQRAIAQGQRIRNQYTAAAEESNVSFDQLMSAWGLARRPLDIELPRLTHVLHD